MKRVWQVLKWSPYPRGTWQFALLYILSLAVVITVIQLIMSVDLASWLGAMTGVAIVGAVMVVLALRRTGQTSAR